MQKRVFYIANAYDGRYFVLTDNLDEYFQRLSAYALNLEKSAKTNHYSFGSVEMSESEYLDAKRESISFEQERITQRKQEQTPKSQPEIHPVAEEETADNVIPLFQ